MAQRIEARAVFQTWQGRATSCIRRANRGHGCRTTMINEQLLRNLGLTPTSQTRVLTATSGGKGEACDVYDVCIEIVDKAGNPMWRVQPVEVLARPLLNQGTDGMLGRDLLDLCVLEYDGPAKVFRLTFPVSTVQAQEGRT